MFGFMLILLAFYMGSLGLDSTKGKEIAVGSLKTRRVGSAGF